MSPDVAFIIGPGRSGTTLLYKLLCLHPDVAYVSTVERLAPWLPLRLSATLRPRGYRVKLRGWFSNKGEAFLPHRPLLRRWVPAPVEGENLFASCGVPMFPSARELPTLATAERLRQAFAALRRGTGASLFLSKRTANNRRLHFLDAAFPEARYLVLTRDGRDVAASLRNVGWWDSHPLWWDRWHRTPAQVVAPGEDMLALCAYNWVAELDIIEDSLQRIRPSRVARLRYEDLVVAPARELGRLLEFLGLERRTDYQEAVSGITIEQGRRRWQERWTPQQIALVERAQRTHLIRLGYSV